MKRVFTFLALFAIVFLFHKNSFGQAASVQWDCVADQNPTTTVGNIVAQPLFGNKFEVRDYTGGAITGPLSTNHQRWWPGRDAAGTAITWGPEKAPLADRYIQLEVAPKAGNNFTVQKVELYMGAGGTNNMRANVAYSTSLDFSATTSIADTIKLKQGSSKPEDTLIVFNGSVEVKSGGKFLVRIFPWYTGSASNSKYVYLQKLSISGTTAPGTGIEENELPISFSLSQNFPNPFNPATKISYSIATPSQTKLVVYNAIGSEVATLVNGFKNAGKYDVTFDASNLPSGVYFYRLTTPSQNITRKMLLVK